jgi:hypothetical protein
MSKMRHDAHRAVKRHKRETISHRYQSPHELVDIITYNTNETTISVGELFSLLVVKIRTPDEPEKSYIACIEKGEKICYVYDMSQDEPMYSITSEEKIYLVAFLSQNEIVLYSRRLVAIWNTEQQCYIRKIEVDIVIETITMIGSFIIGDSGEEHTIVINTTDGNCRYIETPDIPHTDVCKYDDNHFCICSTDCFIIYNLHTLEMIRTLEFKSVSGLRSIDLVSPGQIVMAHCSTLSIISMCDSSQFDYEIPMTKDDYLIFVRKLGKDRFVIIYGAYFKNETVIWNNGRKEGIVFSSNAIRTLPFCVKNSLVVYIEAGTLKVYDANRGEVTRKIENKVTFAIC